MSQTPLPPSDRQEPSDRQRLIAGLYAQAFREFGVWALWSLRQLDNPSIEDALAITRTLRTEGNMAARRLAEQIESAARADH